MTEYLAALAPDELPDIEYLTVDAEQRLHIDKAMDLAVNQTRFTVTSLPIDTAENRLQAATEMAGYNQAKESWMLRSMGGFAMSTTEDRTPQFYFERLERRISGESEQELPTAIVSLLKIVKHEPDLSSYELLKTYYEPS